MLSLLPLPKPPVSYKDSNIAVIISSRGDQREYSPLVVFLVLQYPHTTLKIQYHLAEGDQRKCYVKPDV